MKKNAFTLVEVVLTLAVASVTLVTLFQIIFLVRNLYAGSGIKVKLLEKQLIINQKVNADFNFKKLLMLRKCSSTCLEFTFETGEIKKLSYDRNNKTFTYGDYSTKLVGQSVFGNIKMNTTTVYDTLLTDNSILSIDIPVYNPEFEGEDFGFHLVYQYNPKKTSVDSVNINDTVSSDKEIYLIGGEFYTIFSSMEFSDPGYYLRDSSGSLVENSSEVTVSGSVDKTPGTYYLLYSYKNSLGEVVSTKKRVVRVLEGVKEFSYNTSNTCENYTIPASGMYKFEVWGAQGGSTNSYATGGKGAYTVGYKYMNINTILTVCVGSAGSAGKTTDVAGGFNGGGKSVGASNGAGGSGGGATDIRTSSSFTDTIIVAGGGGGSSSRTTASVGGAGGGGTGTYTTTSYNGMGGTLTSGGAAASYTTSITKSPGAGTKLNGGAGGLYSTTYSGGAGGGGYYGGGGGVRYGTGGGGSSYCGSMLNCTMYNGTQNFIQPNNTTSIGKSGNGYARITLINY